VADLRNPPGELLPGERIDGEGRAVAQSDIRNISLVHPDHRLHHGQVAHGEQQASGVVHGPHDRGLALFDVEACDHAIDRRADDRLRQPVLRLAQRRAGDLDAVRRGLVQRALHFGLRLGFLELLRADQQ
jgi:hypothetical protein